MSLSAFIRRRDGSSTRRRESLFLPSRVSVEGCGRLFCSSGTPEYKLGWGWGEKFGTVEKERKSVVESTEKEVLRAEVEGPDQIPVKGTVHELRNTGVIWSLGCPRHRHRRPKSETEDETIPRTVWYES